MHTRSCRALCTLVLLLTVPSTGSGQEDRACAPLPVHTAQLAEQLHADALIPTTEEREPPPRRRWAGEARLSDRVLECVSRTGSGLALSMLPAAIETRYNSAFPRPMNDGSFRPGVGTLIGGVAGFTASAGPITLVVRPEFHYHQNDAFDIVEQTIPNHSPYVHHAVGTRIDLPQRFGNRSFSVLHPGQSTLRADWRGVAAGISTENLWWGPALRNPLIMSSAAPGFPHAFVGSSRPFDIRIGHLHVRTFVGRTAESQYFDFDDENDHTLMSGTIATFEPAPLPGLVVGASRTFALRQSEGVGVGTLLETAFTGLRDNRIGVLSDNQHAAVFAQWAFPRAGVEVYGEFARIDHWWEWVELVTAPQKAGARMWGVQKTFGDDRNGWRVLVEAADLVDPFPLNGPVPQIVWYVHSGVRQGHTNQGQLLGAPIGPGARSQVLAVDRFSDAFDVGLELTRTLYNEETYASAWWPNFYIFGHDAELGALLRGGRSAGVYEVQAALGMSRRWNRSFLNLPDVVNRPGGWTQDDLRRENNLYFELRGVWRPDWRLGILD
jgi:hypothetical protein